MELRSTTKKRERNEFRELQLRLASLGYYEEGMNLQEMHEIMEALQDSIAETNFSETDITKAIRESELNFEITHGDVLNSTMINSQNTDLPEFDHNVNITQSGYSPLSSPITPALKITVQADFHRALDWSPPAKTYNTEVAEKKRNDLQRKLSIEQIFIENIQYSDNNNSSKDDSASKTDIDSGVCSIDATTSSSTSSQISLKISECEQLKAHIQTYSEDYFGAEKNCNDDISQTAL